MELDRTGCTRVVFITKRYAFKIPNFFESWGDKWRLLLHGLLANMQEYRFSRAKYPELCPVIFYVPFGLLVVMPRVRVMTVEEFKVWDAQSFINKENYILPVESKWTSFGYLNGEIVAIDYGS